MNSDNLQMDLTNLGAKELIRYDFGHCPIDKVTFISTCEFRRNWMWYGSSSFFRRMSAPVTM